MAPGPDITLSDTAVISAFTCPLDSKMYALRVGFISNASGERFAWPGAADENNRWTVPVSVFEAKNIIGHYLVQLEPSNAASGLQLARGPDGEILQSAAVQGFIDQNNQIRCHGRLEALADIDGLVRVVSGEARLRETFEELPCTSLSDVCTPRSDCD